MSPKEPLFISYTLNELGRTIVVEEDQYSIWVYLLDEEEEGIEIAGFLCSVKEPVDFLDDELLKAQESAPPLLKEYANEFAYRTSITSDMLDVEFVDKRYIEVRIKDVLYLRMDIDEGVCYSKALRKDGPYGLCLKDNN